MDEKSDFIRFAFCTLDDPVIRDFIRRKIGRLTHCVTFIIIIIIYIYFFMSVVKYETIFVERMPSSSAIKISRVLVAVAAAAAVARHAITFFRSSEYPTPRNNDM